MADYISILHRRMKAIDRIQNSLGATFPPAVRGVALQNEWNDMLRLEFIADAVEQRETDRATVESTPDAETAQPAAKGKAQKVLN